MISGCVELWMVFEYFVLILIAKANICRLAEIPNLGTLFGPVHLTYNPSFLACFFIQNSIFLSQQISQQCFSAGLLAQPNGAIVPNYKMICLF
jgi:hypothetical protein